MWGSTLRHQHNVGVLARDTEVQRSQALSPAYFDQPIPVFWLEQHFGQSSKGIKDFKHRVSMRWRRALSLYRNIMHSINCIIQENCRCALLHRPGVIRAYALYLATFQFMPFWHPGPCVAAQSAVLCSVPGTCKKLRSSLGLGVDYGPVPNADNGGVIISGQRL